MKSIELPSRIDRLEILLAPDRVRIVSSGRGWRETAPQLLAELTCTPVGNRLWSASVAALAQWLQDNPAARQAKASVRLASRFVRYTMLPWSEELAGRKEEQTLACIVYEGIYGEAAKDWRIAIASARYGEPRLMAAIDQTLLTALGELFPGKRLSTIRPTLVAILAGCRDKLPMGEVQLAVVESGAILFLGQRNRRVTSVKLLLAETDHVLELPALMEREALLNGFDLNSVGKCYCVQHDYRGSIAQSDALTGLPAYDPLASAVNDELALEWRNGRTVSYRSGWAILTLSVAALLGVMGQQSVMLNEAEVIQAEVDARSASITAVPVAPEVEAARRQIEAVSMRLNFPWGALLRTLESSAGEDVVLLAVEPDTANRQVKIEAEARDWAAMIDYIGMLDGEGVFVEAHLVSHQIEKSDPQMPLRFVVMCEMRARPVVVSFP